MEVARLFRADPVEELECLGTLVDSEAYEQGTSLGLRSKDGPGRPLALTLGGCALFSRYPVEDLESPWTAKPESAVPVWAPVQAARQRWVFGSRRLGASGVQTGR